MTEFRLVSKPRLLLWLVTAAVLIVLLALLTIAINDSADARAVPNTSIPQRRTEIRTVRWTNLLFRMVDQGLDFA